MSVAKHIFAEDRQICELVQAAFDQQGADWNHEIFPAIRALRKVLFGKQRAAVGRADEPRE